MYVFLYSTQDGTQETNTLGVIFHGKEILLRLSLKVYPRLHPALFCMQARVSPRCGPIVPWDLSRLPALKINRKHRGLRYCPSLEISTSNASRSQTRPSPIRERRKGFERLSASSLYGSSCKRGMIERLAAALAFTNKKEPRRCGRGEVSTTPYTRPTEAHTRLLNCREWAGKESNVRSLQPARPLS